MMMMIIIVISNTVGFLCNCGKRNNGHTNVEVMEKCHGYFLLKQWSSLHRVK